MVKLPEDRHGLERRTEARRPDARRRSMPPLDRAARRGASPPNTVSAADAHQLLDRLLQLLERRRLSAAEMRVLLALHERDRTIADLAEELGQGTRTTWRAGRALSARGLARWRQGGTQTGTTVGLTRAGLATLRPLLTAAGQTAAD